MDLFDVRDLASPVRSLEYTIDQPGVGVYEYIQYCNFHILENGATLAFSWSQGERRTRAVFYSLRNMGDQAEII